MSLRQIPPSRWRKALPMRMIGSILLSGVLLAPTACAVDPGKLTQSTFNQTLETFRRGETRLVSSVATTPRWGLNRSRLKALYDAQRWRELAVRIAMLDHNENLSWYYLARAADGLGYRDAARVYYRQAQTAAFKCDGLLFNNCDGIHVLGQSTQRLALLKRADANEKSNARPTDAAGVPAATKAARPSPVVTAKRTAPKRPATATVAENTNAVAVIIGNRTYSAGLPPVEFAHNDAVAMKRFVIDRLGFRAGNVIDLRDASLGEMEAVFGNERDHHGRLFDWVRQDQSDVVVFYSGHGVPGLRDRRSYLLPVDGDPNRPEIVGFPLDVMQANLEKLSARSVTLFLDACFSGSSHGGALIRSASGLAITPKLPPGGAGLVVVTAAASTQIASWDPDARHGLFTRHLLEALGGVADTQEWGNGDGKVTVGEVKAYLDDEMTYQARRRYGRDQTATVTGSLSTVLSSARSPGS